MLIRNPITRQASYDFSFHQWMQHALSTIPGSPRNIRAMSNAIGWASRKAASDTPYADPVDAARKQGMEATAKLYDSEHNPCDSQP